MRRILWSVPLLVVVPALWAQDQPKEKPAKQETPAKEKVALDPSLPPAEQFKKLSEQFKTAMDEAIAAVRAAKTARERNDALMKRPDPREYAAVFAELAEENAKDPVAVDALAWIAQNSFGPEAQKAINTLFKDHITSDKIGPVVLRLMYGGGEDTEQRLRTVLEKNPHQKVQGPACYALAAYLKNQARGSENVPEEVEQLLDRAVKEFGDVELYRGKLASGTEIVKSVGDMAGAELFEIRHLAIGKVAPDIAGEDLDGKSFKLTDYRGKVVVLDFWGDW